MSYARSPRPVCSMTMGMRLACMSGGGASWPSRIVPGLLFMGNAFRRRWRHGTCSRRWRSHRPHESGQGAIAGKPRAQSGARLGTIVERAHALGHLLLPDGDRLDLRAHLVLAHGDLLPLRDRVEQQLRLNLLRRARAELLAECRPGLLAVRARREPRLEAGDQRLRA